MSIKTEKLKANAIAAADALNSDTSCEPAETLSALEEVRDHLVVLIGAIDADLAGSNGDDAF